MILENSQREGKAACTVSDNSHGPQNELSLAATKAGSEFHEVANRSGRTIRTGLVVEKGDLWP